MAGLEEPSTAPKAINTDTLNPEPSSPTHKPQPPAQLSLSTYSTYTYKPTPFFFYGSLADPLLLKSVLQSATPPISRPARVQFYKIKLWGQYPALVSGPPDSYVDGMICIIETAEQQKKLERYETDVYCVADVEISVEGKEVEGKTFKWARDPGELEDGTWSSKGRKMDLEEGVMSHFGSVEG